MWSNFLDPNFPFRQKKADNSDSQFSMTNWNIHELMLVREVIDQLSSSRSKVLVCGKIARWMYKIESNQVCIFTFSFFDNWSDKPSDFFTCSDAHKKMDCDTYVANGLLGKFKLTNYIKNKNISIGVVV